MTIETILIVDDEPDNLTLLEKRLRAAGFKTLRAANGEEALDSPGNFCPNLILLDLMMPGLSGYDIARLLQRHPETAETTLHISDRPVGSGQPGKRSFHGSRRLYHQTFSL
jgi:CheY-like chemotaxis protein